ncbi:hypothetical protein [uncultured Aquimarina sp.]|uniref:hypothetical protein n=1 Tax=uncultured Aquimarina sp. TaxID=575652 RepID=UPI0026302B1D|nr:hypothetical protein [uncultured Aquimarina sp.]
MIKKSIKYLVIIFINLIILTSLLAIWTDKFELEFNSWVRPIEFLKLIGISILGLISLRVLVKVFRKLKVSSVKRRIGISICLILFISSFSYIDYGLKIYRNRIVNNELRNEIVKKIKPVEFGLANGNRAENLTGNEYAEITKIKWFPKLPKEAENISYSYDYDGFLPDYSFSLSYDLPKEMKVDTMSYKDGTFSKRRNFEIIGNKKRVTYSEGQW